MFRSEREEIVVIGGGPAGSAAAALLARGGRSVTLIEKHEMPRDKLCGEFLSPEAESDLEHLGVREEVLAKQPARIDTARFNARDRAIELALPGAAIGISRKTFDALLFSRAKACGAHAIVAAEVVGVRGPRGEKIVELVDHKRERSELRTSLVIAAHGRRARIDKQLDRSFMRQKSGLFGMKRHHRAKSNGLEGLVELHAFDGGYIGMSYVEGGIVNVCTLASEGVLSSAKSHTFDDVAEEIARRSPSFRARWETLAPAGALALSVAQVPLESKETSRDGVFFCGDAAGMIAPLAGDGQAMALASARLLASILSGARLDAAAIAGLERAWDRAWKSAFARRMRLGRWLQRALLSPRAAEALIRVISLHPALGRALVRATRG
jgi:menaquinone-9 beta-reductase